MLSKGEMLRKGGGGIAPNWPCWDTKNPIARNRGVSQNIHPKEFVFVPSLWFEDRHRGGVNVLKTTEALLGPWRPVRQGTLLTDDRAWDDRNCELKRLDVPKKSKKFRIT